MKKGASMGEVSIIGLDLAKRSFQVHGAYADGSVAFRKKLTRAQVVRFFADQPSCVVAMEACATAHDWGREIGALGHEIKLIPPVYVKPVVKRQKNDAADAEAIAEAASRPTMRTVPVKSRDQQSRAVLFRTRDLLVRQRTQVINGAMGTSGGTWQRRPEEGGEHEAPGRGSGRPGQRVAAPGGRDGADLS
jgi:transposase